MLKLGQQNCTEGFVVLKVFLLFSFIYKESITYFVNVYVIEFLFRTKYLLKQQNIILQSSFYSICQFIWYMVI